MPTPIFRAMLLRAGLLVARASVVVLCVSHLSRTPMVNAQPAKVWIAEAGAFVPRMVEVETGDVVEWWNSTRFVHTVTSDVRFVADPGSVSVPGAARPFHSGNLAPGQAFSHRFVIPGEYRYVCVLDDGSTVAGVVLVSPRGAE